MRRILYAAALLILAACQAAPRLDATAWRGAAAPGPARLDTTSPALLSPDVQALGSPDAPPGEGLVAPASDRAPALEPYPNLYNLWVDPDLTIYCGSSDTREPGGVPGYDFACVSACACVRAMAGASVTASPYGTPSMTIASTLRWIPSKSSWLVSIHG